MYGELLNDKEYSTHYCIGYRLPAFSIFSLNVYCKLLLIVFLL